jgi:hypothetical protein
MRPWEPTQERTAQELCPHCKWELTLTRYRFVGELRMFCSATCLIQNAKDVEHAQR